jgi:hypothetical protein
MLDLYGGGHVKMPLVLRQELLRSQEYPCAKGQVAAISMILVTTDRLANDQDDAHQGDDHTQEGDGCRKFAQ